MYFSTWDNNLQQKKLLHKQRWAKQWILDHRVTSKRRETNELAPVLTHSDALRRFELQCREGHPGGVPTEWRRHRWESWETKAS
jgi:hypothetical protein